MSNPQTTPARGDGLHCVYGSCRAASALNSACHPGCVFQGSEIGDVEMFNRNIKSAVANPTRQKLLEAAWQRMSEAVISLGHHHALTLRLSPRELTVQDIEMGNTVEFQHGFVSALEMVTRDYVAKIVETHNAVAETLK